MCWTMRTGSGKAAGSAGSRIQGPRDPGGDADGNDGGSGRDWLRVRLREGRAGCAGKDGRAQRLAEGLRRSTAGRGGEGADFGNEFLGEGLERGFAAGLSGRFGYVVGCAAGEGLNGDLCAALVSELHMMTGILFPRLRSSLQGSKAVHDGHLDVEEDEVGTIERGR